MGQRWTYTVTIRSVGTAPVSIDEVELAAQEQWSLSTDNCSAIILPPAEECRLAVTIDARERGQANGSLYVKNDAAAGPIAIPLYAEILGPSPSASPAQVDFGRQPVRSTVMRTVTVAEHGDGFSVEQIELHGDPAFSVISDRCTSQGVSPSNPCSIDLAVAAQTPGLTTGSLEVSYQWWSGGTERVDALNIPLAVESFVPDPEPPGRPSLYPEHLDFGSVALDSTQLQSFTVRNNGSKSLWIEDVVLEGSSSFGLWYDTCTGRFLNSWDPCTVGIRFEPQTASEFTGTVRVVVPEATAEVTLLGFGAEPIAQVSPSSVDFGAQAVGSPSALRNVVVTNVGSGTLRVYGASIQGFNPPFFIEANTCSARSLDPGETCSVGVRFIPPQLGRSGASLVLGSDSILGPEVVDLSGTGVGPIVQVRRDGSFSETPVGEQGESVGFTVANSGSDTLHVDATWISAGGEDFVILTDDCTGTSVAAGDACRISVAPVPSRPGTREGYLVIASNAQYSLVPVSLEVAGRDTRGPVTTIWTQADALLLPLIDSIDGLASDDFSGISSISIQMEDVRGINSTHGASCHSGGGTQCIWAFQIPPLVPGPYTIRARAFDTAGNLGPFSDPVSFVIL